MWVIDQNGKSITNTENYDRIGIYQENEEEYLVVAARDYVEMPGLTRFSSAVRKIGVYEKLETAQEQVRCRAAGRGEPRDAGAGPARVSRARF